MNPSIQSNPARFSLLILHILSNLSLATVLFVPVFYLDLGFTSEMELGYEYIAYIFMNKEMLTDSFGIGWSYAFCIIIFFLASRGLFLDDLTGRTMPGKITPARSLKVIRINFWLASAYFVFILWFTQFKVNDFFAPLSFSTYTFIPAILTLIIMIIATVLKNTYAPHFQAEREDQIAVLIELNQKIDQFMEYKKQYDEKLLTETQYTEHKYVIAGAVENCPILSGTELSPADLNSLINKLTTLANCSVIKHSTVIRFASTLTSNKTLPSIFNS